MLQSASQLKYVTALSASYLAPNVCWAFHSTAIASSLETNVLSSLRISSFHYVGQCKGPVQVGQSAIFWGEKVLALQQLHTHTHKSPPSTFVPGLICTLQQEKFLSFSRRVPLARNPLNMFCLNPLLFASCTDTFSKCCKITIGMKRSAQ
jgi:hypothetical protein